MPAVFTVWPLCAMLQTCFDAVDSLDVRWHELKQQVNELLP